MAEDNEANAAVTTQVVIVNRNLRIDSFIPEDDELRNSDAWEDWRTEFDRQCRYFGLTEPGEKKEAMIIFGGKELARLEKSLPNPTERPEGVNADVPIDDYNKLQWKLDNYFLKKKNTHHARYKFNSMKPEHKESTVKYVARLREAAKNCNFENTEGRILEHVILTIQRKDLIRKTISKRWDLATFIKEAAELEDIDTQLAAMRAPEADVARVGTDRRGWHRQARQKQDSKTEQTSTSERKTCTYCGKNNHPPGRNCPAYGTRCSICDKYNHFVAVQSPDRSRAEGDEESERQKQKRSQRRPVQMKTL